MRQRHKRLLIGAAVAALVAITTQASAHVTVGIPTLYVTDLELRAPVEPGNLTPDELAAHHTDKVVVTIPVGFKVEQCHETLDFGCAVTGDEVTWTRQAGNTNFQLVDFFSLSVRTPGIRGTYSMPALQIYSDGEEVCWCDPDPEADHPAPQIRVQGPDRAPAEATGSFRPLAELGGGNPCPQSVIDEATQLGIDPAVHCGHFGFAPPADTPAPPLPPEPGPDVRGTARLVRTASQTSVEVLVTGLDPGATYTSHLHEGTCADVLSLHYKDDPAGPDAPPNELWPSSDPNDPTAGLTADDTGSAAGSAVASWVARPTARAIWIHAPADPSDPHAHARIGCADLV